MCASLGALATLGGACAEPAPEPTGSRAGGEPGRTSSATGLTGTSATGAAKPDAQGPGKKWPGKKVALEGGAMGTKVSIIAYVHEDEDEATVRPKLEEALAEIRRLEALMTTWNEASELSAVNRAAGKAAVKVSSETLEVVKKSLWMAERSEGVFDISFEGMRGVWKFDHDLDPVVPSREAVLEARKRVDWKKIELDEKASTLRLAAPGMRVSLGGIAKGYAVDIAQKHLRKAGLTSFFVQAGGDLYVAGRKPDGTRYRVGARDPRGKGADDFFAQVEVEDAAFSTAGDYERSFLQDGVRYHHIIDPRTGYPATACRSVTVWASDAFTADAIDDAVFILGPEKGLALVESLDGVGALVVDAKNRVHVSKRLEGKVTIVHPPTDAL